MAHPRALERAHACKGPYSLKFISFTVNLPLLLFIPQNSDLEEAFPDPLVSLYPSQIKMIFHFLCYFYIMYISDDCVCFPSLPY